MNVAEKNENTPKGDHIVSKRRKTMTDAKQYERKPQSKQQQPEIVKSVTNSVSDIPTTTITSSVADNGTIPDVRSWTCHEIARYFEKYFNPNYAQIFKNEQIDGESLLLMRRQDLINQNLKITLGFRLKMWNVVSKLQTGSNDPTQTWK